MSDLIPRIYLQAPSALQNRYDYDRGLHAHVVTTAENAANDSERSYVSLVPPIMYPPLTRTPSVSAFTALEPEGES